MLIGMPIVLSIPSLYLRSDGVPDSRRQVGSGHMSLTLREDWRQHIRMAARDLGVKHIRVRLPPPWSARCTPSLYPALVRKDTGE